MPNNTKVQSHVISVESYDWTVRFIELFYLLALSASIQFLLKTGSNACKLILYRLDSALYLVNQN
jgi:hypothetical protein